MKNIIVTIGEVLLGVIIFGLIFGDNNSFKTETFRIFEDGLSLLRDYSP